MLVDGAQYAYCHLIVVAKYRAWTMGLDKNMLHGAITGSRLEITLSDLGLVGRISASLTPEDNRGGARRECCTPAGRNGANVLVVAIE
ncbi:MAG: hypothetical protein GPOALKHO_000589 [Sodalis sp.]|nr:MAG: hypothetical protein GPOALKHO_000589 [Sodalis sp.]